MASGKKKKTAAHNRYKLVIVGDGACGKTSILTVFKTNEFPDSEYVPTIFETSVAHLKLDGADEDAEEIELTLWDTAGQGRKQESYDKLRPLSYPNSDVVLICYSIDRPESLSNVENTWSGEVRHFCRGVPIVLVGNKTDLRTNEDGTEKTQSELSEYLSTSDGRAMASKIKAVDFVECSALRMEGIQQVFQTAARAAVSSRRNSRIVRKIKRNCTLM